MSPPSPLPKTIASDDRRSRCSAFVRAEEHERFCPSPRSCPRLCSGCTASDDRRSRCSAFVCAEEHERFCLPPPLPKTIASDDRRSRCSAFVCAEEHERFGQMTGDEGAVQGAMLQGVLLASVWLRPSQAYVCVWLSPFCVRR